MNTAKLFNSIVAAVILTLSASCARGSSTAPTPAEAVLTGQWGGTLTSPIGGPTALGDWGHFALDLQSTGNGELVTNDGQHFSVVGHAGSDGTRVLDLVLNPSSLCPSVELAITTVQVDAAGHVNGFSGALIGRCPNTLQDNFTCVKS